MLFHDAFLAYVHTHFNATVPAHPAWEAAQALDVDLNDRASHRFVKTLVQAYPELSKCHPDLHVVAQPLFFAIAAYAVDQPNTNPWWLDVLVDMVAVWTKRGTCDMSPMHADALGAKLRAQASDGARARGQLFEMCYASSLLWQNVGQTALDAASLAGQVDTQVMLLLHRYQPESTVMDDQTLTMSYGKMCGWLAAFQPDVVDMPNVLVPLHHNARAWRMALQECQPPAPGHWMLLGPALSTLHLCPSHPCAWGLLGHLTEQSLTDSSCADLLKCVCATNEEMTNAFDAIWPVVSGMYDAGERNDAAVAQWETLQRPDGFFALPDLGMD